MAVSTHAQKNSASPQAAPAAPRQEAMSPAPGDFDAEAAASHGHHFGDIPTHTTGPDTRSAGQPLPGALHQEMRQAFRTDFSAVRLHVGGHASRYQKDALTQGNDIHFSPSAYRPHEPAGKALIAHELTHVLQQRAGRVASEGPGALNAHPGLEREANETGLQVALGEPAPHQGPLPSTSAASATGPSAMAPAQGGPKMNWIQGKLNWLGKKFRREKNSYLKSENVPEDQHELLESDEAHDAKAQYKRNKLKQSAANTAVSGVTSTLGHGSGTVLKIGKSARNVYNDQKTINKLNLVEKFANDSDNETLPLANPLAQETPSENTNEMLSQVKKVTREKQATHALKALPLVGSGVGLARGHVRGKAITNAADLLHSELQHEDPFAQETLKAVSKGNQNKINSATTVDNIKKLL